MEGRGGEGEGCERGQGRGGEGKRARGLSARRRGGPRGPTPPLPLFSIPPPFSAYLPHRPGQAHRDRHHPPQQGPARDDVRPVQAVAQDAGQWGGQGLHQAADEGDVAQLARGSAPGGAHEGEGGGQDGFVRFFDDIRHVDDARRAAAGGPGGGRVGRVHRILRRVERAAAGGGGGGGGAGGRGLGGCVIRGLVGERERGGGGRDGGGVCVRGRKEGRRRGGRHEEGWDWVVAGGGGAEPAQCGRGGADGGCAQRRAAACRPARPCLTSPRQGGGVQTSGPGREVTSQGGPPGRAGRARRSA